MDIDLAGIVNGAAERLVRGEMRGELVEAEHLNRYWWVSSLVAGKRVLDAGCGTGYGSTILAAGGAQEVIGVDRATHVIEAVRSVMPARVRLHEGDVESLSFDNGSFDVVVCFEVIEHLENPAAALSEFARVLTESGLLVVSSPNRAVYTPGNPHHRHEFLPNELRAALEEHFANVMLYRQSNWVTSAILDEAAFLARDEEAFTATLRKVVPSADDSEVYTVALATNTRLPELDPTAALTSAIDLRNLVRELERTRRELQRSQEKADDLSAQVARRQEQVDGLAREVDELQTVREALGDSRAHIEGLQARLDASADRQADLRRLLLDAHQQLVRRDEAFRARHEEDLRPRDDEIRWLREIVAEREKAVEQLNSIVGTRAWRLACRYWGLKQRVGRLSRG
jgi:2-polyprenyl-3-methyl-5-hydroxy-6-metoxy-1,4-benzoquinol methylase